MGEAREFWAGLEVCCDEVFSSHPELTDHRREHPWLTGSLGDPFSPVWFVAENPSINQARKMRGTSVEQQWAVSRGDRLLRESLAAHGFKTGGPLEPGGWRCYITDVIKSASVAKVWSATPREQQWVEAQAWASTFAYELTHGRPRVLVALGKRARETIDRLRDHRLCPSEPGVEQIEHYSYIAMRPERMTRRGPMHPERVAAWDAHFADLARRFMSDY